MTDIENKYYQVGEDSIASQPVASGSWFKSTIALFCGVGLALLYITAQSASGTAESTNLVGLSSQFRASSAVGKSSFVRPMDHCVLPVGCSPYQNLALSAIKALNEGKRVRDVVMDATGQNQEVVAAAENAASQLKKEMSGITAPLGFWDPVGISTNIPEGRLLYFREAELKHGRVAMLASLGILVGEKFHPWFGVGDIPSVQVFGVPTLNVFWVQLFIFCFFLESANDWNGLGDLGGKGREMKPGYVPGDLGFDPLGLKPKDAKAFKEMQTKELNNGRLAMFASLGMLAQELVTKQKIDPTALR